MQKMPNGSLMILAKQSGCFAPGCQFNVESTDVLLLLSAIKRGQIHATRFTGGS
jgi:hypothetical protein